MGAKSRWLDSNATWLRRQVAGVAPEPQEGSRGSEGLGMSSIPPVSHQWPAGTIVVPKGSATSPSPNGWWRVYRM